jgi:hypothetical protein
MSTAPSGLILQSLSINGQSLTDPTVQAPTGPGDAAITESLESSVLDASENTVLVNGDPVDLDGD